MNSTNFTPYGEIEQLVMQQQELVFSKEKFIEDVFNGEYILVVGSEVIMDNSVEPTGDVNKYILRVLNKILNKNYKDFNDILRHSSEGIDPIRNFLKLKNDGHKIKGYAIDDISPELRGLLSTGLFRIILTTTFDSYLEKLLESIWKERGETLRVVNVEEKKTLDELNNILKECREEKVYKQPTLFYIFGKAAADDTMNFVHSDDDAIQIIEKWIKATDHDQILKLIRNRKILALGCKFDDWYFRFFWYILKHDFKRFGEGQVAFSLNEKDRSEDNLKEFLKNKKIYRHGDARSFMNDITQMLTSTDLTNPFYQLIVSQRRRQGIFLSYCSKDVIMASQLFFILIRHGYNVWFDNTNLKGGDNYNNEINDAIAEARIFIPILTPNVAKDLMQGKTDNYYNYEWKLACQTGIKTILPLATNGYNLRADYHTQVFESIISTPSTGVDLMRNDGIQKLIEAINSHLI